MFSKLKYFLTSEIIEYLLASEKLAEIVKGIGAKDLIKTEVSIITFCRKNCFK